MKKIALTLLLAAVAAIPASAKEPQQSPLLALVSDGRFATLEKVDPVTLDQRAGRVYTLPAQTSFLATSPDHRRVAVGVDYPGRLQVFNVGTLVPVRRHVTLYGAPAAGLWTRAGIVVLTWGYRDSGFYATMNARLRNVRYHRFAGNTVAAARGADFIAAVVAPQTGIGPARLAVIDAGGRLHSVDLPGISAGTAAGETEGSVRTERPALALSPDGSRAVVVSSAATVAEVDLTTMRATEHFLAARTLAKSMDGAIRTAAWVGDTVAVAGVDLAQARATPAGLTLVDTTKWAARRVDRAVVDVAGAEDSFVGYGSTAAYEELELGGDAGLAAQGDGVAAYTAAGAMRFRVFAGTPVSYLQVVGRYAYTRYLSSTHSSMWSVIDVASGRVLTTTDSRGELELIAP